MVDEVVSVEQEQLNTLKEMFAMQKDYYDAMHRELREIKVRISEMGK